MNDILDRDELLDRVDNDMEFLAETVAMFNEDGAQLLADIRRAVVDGDAAALHSAAHAFKGMAANFCANATVEAALKLEMMGKSADLAGAEEAAGALEAESQRLGLALEQLLRDG
jgi:HPt (histidine-containing phosphotransfer) domain-containing protein